MRIGYQGDIGSNAEEAASKFCKRNGLGDAVLVPLISSAAVVGALASGNIGYGVMAVRNNIGGVVTETRDAIAGRELIVVDEMPLDIHHCLFVLPGADISELVFVASHIQALAQTRKWRESNYSQLEELETADTAIAAYWLSTGRLSTDAAVICRKEAGEQYGLYLIAENIEDMSSQTTFRLYASSTCIAARF